MAEKRVFSKSVVRTDVFLDMSLSTQALYFHLCLDADAKGFVSPGLVMRMIGAQPDDLKVLMAKNFVIPFDSGVLVVAHWNVHNNIRLDREAPSQFVEELKKLTTSKEGKYSLPEYSRTTPAQHNITQHNITSSSEMITSKISFSERQIALWRKKYSHLDVDLALEAANIWLEENPTTIEKLSPWFEKMWLVNGIATPGNQSKETKLSSIFAGVGGVEIGGRHGTHQ